MMVKFCHALPLFHPGIMIYLKNQKSCLKVAGSIPVMQGLLTNTATWWSLTGCRTSCTTTRVKCFLPCSWKMRFKFSPYIKEAVIYGDKEDFVACLINIDPIVVGKWAEDRGISYTTYMDLSGKERWLNS
jgi:hypothetical protein